MPTPKGWKNEKGAAGLVDAAAMIDLEERLQRGISVKDYGAKGDGATDDSTAIQAAINAASEIGAEIVFCPRGTYIVGTTLTLKSNVHLMGAGANASILKLKNGAKKDIITNASYGAGGIHNFSVRDLSIDGNVANNAGGASSGMKLDGTGFLLDNIYVFNCAEYGIYQQQTANDETLRAYSGPGAFARNVIVWDCEKWGISWGGHDCEFTDCIAISNEEGGFLWREPADDCKALQCHSYGKQKYAMAFECGYMRFVGCEAEGASTANVKVAGDNGQWIGGEVFRDSEGNGKVGFQFAKAGAAARGFNTIISGVRLRNQTEGAFAFLEGCTADHSVIQATVYATEGKVVASGAGLVAPGATVTMNVYAYGGVEAASSAIHSPNLRTVDPWKPSAAIAENIPRWAQEMTNMTETLASGTLYVVGGMILPAGQKISNITFFSGSTALATGTHQWFCLLDQNLKVLRKTADDTNKAWEANSEKTLALSSTYIPELDMPVYVGILVTAITVPTLRGAFFSTVVALAKSPVFAGKSTTGLTTPASLGETAGAITWNERLPYCLVA